MKKRFISIVMAVGLFVSLGVIYFISQPSVTVILEGESDLSVVSVLVDDKAVDPSGSKIEFTTKPGYGKHTVRVIVQGTEQHKEDVNIAPFSSKTITVQIKSIDKERVLSEQKTSLGISDPVFDSVVSNDGLWLAYRVGEGSNKKIIIATRDSAGGEWLTIDTTIADGGYILDDMPKEIKEYINAL